MQRTEPLPSLRGCRTSQTSRLSRAEDHRASVHAVALARGRRPIVEDVADMPVAVGASHFDARVAQPAVGPEDHGSGKGLPEARPAGPAVELGPRRIPVSYTHLTLPTSDLV